MGGGKGKREEFQTVEGRQSLDGVFIVFIGVFEAKRNREAEGKVV